MCQVGVFLESNIKAQAFFLVNIFEYKILIFYVLSFVFEEFFQEKTI